MGGTSGAPRDPAEQRVLRRLRVATVITVLALLVFAVGVDALGRLFINPDFHVDDVVIGGLIGAGLVAGAGLGVARISLPGGWTLRSPDDREREDQDRDDKAGR